VALYLHSRNTPSWHGAQLKKSAGSTLPLPLSKIVKWLTVKMAVRKRLGLIE